MQWLLALFLEEFDEIIYTIPSPQVHRVKIILFGEQAATYSVMNMMVIQIIPNI